MIPGITLDAGADLTAGSFRPPSIRHFPIRDMKSAEDAHTRAEQQVYDYLWQNAKPLDSVSRAITMGFGAMAKAVRLSESNARINARSLIAKLAMEEFGGYNCERSVGRTYRVFDAAEILRRRRAAGLVRYMRRTLAVVFVDPSGRPIDLGVKRPKPKTGLNLASDSGLNLNVGPGPNLSSAVYDALAQYGAVDDEAVSRLRTATGRVCPDFTDDELVHFIHLKGQLVAGRSSAVSSPIGFLLAAVPKCFTGQDFQHFRQAEREAREREAAERARQEDELQRWYQEQRAILEDPAASEEDRRWARKTLYPDRTV